MTRKNLTQDEIISLLEEDLSELNNLYDEDDNVQNLYSVFCESAGGESKNDVEGCGEGDTNNNNVVFHATDTDKMHITLVILFQIETSGIHLLVGVAVERRL